MTIKVPLHKLNDERDKELLYEGTEGLFSSDQERASFERGARATERTKMSKENFEKMAEAQRVAEEEHVKAHAQKVASFEARIRRNERGVRQVAPRPPMDIKRVLESWSSGMEEDK